MTTLWQAASRACSASSLAARPRLARGSPAPAKERAAEQAGAAAGMRGRRCGRPRRSCAGRSSRPPAIWTTRPTGPQRCGLPSMNPQCKQQGAIWSADDGETPGSSACHAGVGRPRLTPVKKTLALWRGRGRQAEGGGAAEVAVAPVMLALVDAGGGEEWLELVRGALAAALEALPASALFGLVTFGTHVRAASSLRRLPVLICALFGLVTFGMHMRVVRPLQRLPGLECALFGLVTFGTHVRVISSVQCLPALECSWPVCGLRRRQVELAGSGMHVRCSSST